MNTKNIQLQPDLAKALHELGFEEFTEIQERAIPIIQQGKDIIGQSHTGSGKTVAFGFPALEKVSRGQGIQLLILVPTRELCNQIAKELNKFSKYKQIRVAEVYGGVSIQPQIEQARHAEVVVATPGRMLDHLGRRTINTTKIKVLVLDEADKMFEMGFIEDITKIIEQIPKTRQTLLFSATIPTEINQIVHKYMSKPTIIKLKNEIEAGQLTQHYYDVDSRDKFSLLCHLLENEKGNPSIIFCGTRRMVDILAVNLVKQGIRAQALHGGLSQNKRKQVMDAFHAKKHEVLIASDVASRGLDIKNICLVVNYDIPKNSKDYIHRVGRTARAGNSGKVISLLAQRDHDNFRNVLSDRTIIIQKITQPQFKKLFFTLNQKQHYGQHERERPRRHKERHENRIH